MSTNLRDRLTIKEIRDAFPEACETILPREIKRLNKDLRDYKKDIKDFTLRGYDIATERIAKALIKASHGVEGKLVLLDRLEKIRDYMEPKEDSNKVTEEQIQIARDKPIYGLYTFQKVRGNPNKFMALCPFHDENTSSFSVKGNVYHCFGCATRGDSIDFIKRINGWSFIQAVKYLCQST